MKDIAVRGVWYAAGLALGTVTAVAELFFALFAGLALLPVLAWPRGRRAVLRPVGAMAGRLTELERRRLRRFLAVTLAAAPEDGRGTHYLLARWPLGLLGGVVLAAPSPALPTAASSCGGGWSLPSTTSASWR